MVKEFADTQTRRAVLRIMLCQHLNTWEEENDPIDERKCHQDAYIARRLRTKPWKVKRVRLAMHDDEQYENLRWGRGRPKKPLPLDEEEQQPLTSRRTLFKHMSKSLPARAKWAEKKFGKKLK